MKFLIFIFFVLIMIIVISFATKSQESIKDALLMVFKPSIFTESSINDSIAKELKNNIGFKKAFETDKIYRENKLIEYRKQFSERTQMLRNNIIKSLYIILGVLLMSILSAYIMRRFFPVGQNFIITIQVVSVLVILWALLGKLGWSLQTGGGTTLQEQVNNYWFRILNSLGAYFLLFSYFYNSIDVSRGKILFAINPKLFIGFAGLGFLVSIRKFINSRIFYIPIVIVSFILSYMFIISKTSDTFQGAFFGFLVGILTFIFAKYSELQSRRYNAMVYLEHELNACFNDLGDNTFQIEKALGTDKLTLISPMPLNLTEDHIKHLGRIELKNDIFPLFVDIKKYNHSLKHAVDMFEKNISALKDFGIKEGNPEVKMEDVIKAYYEQYKQDLTVLWEFGKKLEECIKKCMVEIRFFTKVDQPLLAMVWLLPYYNKKNFSQWMTDDLKRLEKEMAESTRQDEEERKRIRQKIVDSK